MTQLLRKSMLLAPFACLLLLAHAAMAAPIPVKLATAQKPLLPIVIPPGDHPKTKAIATTLADYLGRISGAKFEVTTGDGTSGIALGTVADFPALKLGVEIDTKAATAREDYILRSHAAGLYIVGATDGAVQHGVWDVLYRLGYRQFLPGTHWEIIPKIAEPVIAVDAKEHPDYQSRRITFTYGTWPDNAERVQQWNLRNRATAGIALNTGHAYGNIILRNKKAFEDHPEYAPLIGGERKPGPQAKFCISNPGLRQLVVDYAIKYLADNPSADSVSVDPSDGGGWCECEPCAKMGSVSDRVTLLANQVAQAINQKYAAQRGTLYVGFYAYNFHSPPPTVRVDPHVIVSVATAFIKGNLNVDQLIAAWQKQGATIGMREYFSIIHWDKDMPSARASNPDYMVRTIPHFHDLGARFMSAESSDNWGPNGLAYYIASRVMWDVGEAKRVDAIIDDFLAKSFGPAKAPMTEFYELLNGIHGAKKPPLSDDYVGRLYRALDAAWKTTDDEAIRARLTDLAVYVRFMELYLAYTSAGGAERQRLFEQTVRWAYRSHPTHMIHSLAVYRTKFRDKSIKVPDNATWQIPEVVAKGRGPNPWKSSAPFTAAEIEPIIAAGIANNKLLDFRPVDFSPNLVPATPLQLPQTQAFGPTALRGVLNFFFWVAPGQTEIKLDITAGLFYNNRGPARLAAYVVDDAVAEAEGEEEGDDDAPVQDAPVATAEVEPDQKPHSVTLKVPRPGLYRVQLSERMMGSTMTWSAEQPASIRSSLGNTPGFYQRWAMYFYVPKGTKALGGFAKGNGRILDPAGKPAYIYPAKDAYFSVPVPAGSDGKLWRFESAGGSLALMTVPPYLARSPLELLLPKEVVAADTPR